MTESQSWGDTVSLTCFCAPEPFHSHKSHLARRLPNSYAQERKTMSISKSPRLNTLKNPMGPNLAGNKVCYGTVSGSYGTSIDVGKQINYIVTGLRSETYCNSV